VSAAPARPARTPLGAAEVEGVRPQPGGRAPAHVEPRSDPVRRGAAVDWRGVAWYVLLAYGLAWTAEGVALARGMRFDRLTAGAVALLGAVMFTPAIAAAVVRRVVTREGFASAGLRRGPWRYYVAAWLGVPLLVALACALTVLLGLGEFDPTLSRLTAAIQEQAAGRPLPPLPPPQVLALAIFAQAMTLGVLLTSVATFGEEFGWTGYLLVKLLPLGRWRAALLYGVIWRLWHAPIIAAGFNYPGYPALGVAMMCALTTAFALTQTALRLRSDSVLLTSFFHASVNTQELGVLPLLVAGASPVLGGVTGAVGIAVFAAVGVALLATTHGGSSPAGPQRRAGASGGVRGPRA
jgi:uncharacterized protein